MGSVRAIKRRAKKERGQRILDIMRKGKNPKGVKLFKLLPGHRAKAVRFFNKNSRLKNVAKGIFDRIGDKEADDA